MKVEILRGVDPMPEAETLVIAECLALPDGRAVQFIGAGAADRTGIVMLTTRHIGYWKNPEARDVVR